MLRMSKLLLCIVMVVSVVFAESSMVFADTVADKQQRAAVVDSTIAELESELSNCDSSKLVAHDMANNARALGMPEDDAIIVRAKEIWKTNDDRQVEINAQLVSLRTEQQELQLFKNMTYAGNFKLTGYCACSSCCGKSPSNPAYGKTAMGTRATEGRTVAMDKRFAFGTKVYIEGLGIRTVEDRGGAIHGNRIDVYCDSHSACFAAKYNTTAKVYIINE